MIAKINFGEATRLAVFDDKGRYRSQTVVEELGRCPETGF
jgi:hypothetical protein